MQEIESNQQRVQDLKEIHLAAAAGLLRRISGRLMLEFDWVAKELLADITIWNLSYLEIDPKNQDK
ncbi:MAG: hypothetical protein ACO29P_05710 [Bacteroidia bacterium]|jgi:hypothetical protein